MMNDEEKLEGEKVRGWEGEKKQGRAEERRKALEKNDEWWMMKKVGRLIFPFLIKWNG